MSKFLFTRGCGQSEKGRNRRADDLKNKNESDRVKKILGKYFNRKLTDGRCYTYNYKDCLMD